MHLSHLSPDGLFDPSEGRRFHPHRPLPGRSLPIAPGEAPTGPLTRPGGPVSRGTRTRIAGFRPASGTGQKTLPRGRPKGVGNKARAAVESGRPKTRVSWPRRRPAAAGADRILAG